ncbi:MAG TPA: hypothetical protein VF068_14410 [Rubrobacter sp.]
MNSRTERFGDWSVLHALAQSGRVGGMRPFFAGPNVGRRMAKVRTSIEQVRRKGDRYGEFMAELEAMLAQQGLGSDRHDELGRRVSSLFASRKDWIDRPGATRDAATDYDAIRLYTSDQGYRHIFSVVNGIFRSEIPADFARFVVSAVFLVELLNIDLYNYCWRHPDASHFERVVYRGMCVNREDFRVFSRILHQPAAERYISIPLGLVSTSTRRAEAEYFLKTRLRDDSSLFPLLWKIQVEGMGSDLLDAYHSRFPTSVVSTICAVPVSGLSNYPHEQEVLLRGPFVQVLNVMRSGMVEGKPLHVLEAVMLNGNRDHFSTTRLGEDDGLARELFGSIAGLRRNQLCFEYCKRHGLRDDAAVYREQVEASELRLRELEGSSLG